MKDVFEAYKEQIRLRFDQVRDGEDGTYLQNPTSGNLKKLTHEIVGDELKLSDENILKNFFQKQDKISANVVKAAHVDTFKNASKFLRNDGNVSTIKDVDLVALLVRFEKRPFAKFRRFSGTEDLANEVIPTEAEPPATGFSQPKQTAESATRGKKKYYKWIVLFVFVTIGLIGGFWSYSSSQEQCMVWNGTEYKKIDCQDNSSQGIMHYSNIVSLHDETLKNFRKIKPDSSTVFFKHGKAVVYYSKHKTEVEFFSCDGVHPITRKDLKPVTDYMIKKYVLNKKNRLAQK